MQKTGNKNLANNAAGAAAAAAAQVEIWPETHHAQYEARRAEAFAMI